MLSSERRVRGRETMEMHERFFAVTWASVTRGICDTKRISLILNAATVTFITARLDVLRCSAAKNCSLLIIRPSPRANTYFTSHAILMHVINYLASGVPLRERFILMIRDKNDHSGDPFHSGNCSHIDIITGNNYSFYEHKSIENVSRAFGYLV